MTTSALPPNADYFVAAYVVLLALVTRLRGRHGGEDRAVRTRAQRLACARRRDAPEGGPSTPGADRFVDTTCGGGSVSRGPDQERSLPALNSAADSGHRRARVVLIAMGTG